MPKNKRLWNCFDKHLLLTSNPTLARLAWVRKVHRS